MQKLKKIVALFLVIVLCLTGCGRESAEQKEEKQEISVIAILKAMNSLHWHFVKEGMEQTAKQYDIKLNVIWPETEVDVKTQVRMIQDAIQAAPDVILLAPDDSANIGEYAAQIQEAGIGLIYVDENAEEQSDIPYVGSDNYHAGELAAESIAEKLDSESCVAFIGGSQSQQVHYLRGSGFVKGSETSGQQVVSVIKEVPDCSISGGKKAMKSILEENPEVKGVFCASALLCMGAQETCQSAGRTDVILVGMDTQSDVLTALKNNRIHSVISQNGYEMGKKAIELVVKREAGEEIPVMNYIENEIISKENVNDYLDAFATEGRE